MLQNYTRHLYNLLHNYRKDLHHSHIWDKKIILLINQHPIVIKLISCLKIG